MSCKVGHTEPHGLSSISYLFGMRCMGQFPFSCVRQFLLQLYGIFSAVPPWSCTLLSLLGGQFTRALQCSARRIVGDEHFTGVVHGNYAGLNHCGLH